MDEGFFDFVSQVFAAAVNIYNELIAQVVADQLLVALGEGGDIYEQLMSAAIASAEIWYGMYSPTVYKRGYTMSQRGNISISADISVSGTGVSVRCTTANVSPHAGFSFGFWMYKRGKAFWRPGGDLMALVPSSVNYSVNISQAEADQCFAAALGAVIG